MQEATATMSSSPLNPGANPSASTVDDLARVFNTALVSTRAGASRDFSTELYSLVDSPAFRAILASVRQLSRTTGCSEKEAAETLIETFRKLDQIWTEYIFQEGVDRLKTRIGN
jgi:hypothetical protein